MIHRLFTLASTLSLLACILTLSVAVWASHADARMMARHGRLWCLVRPRAGEISIITMPWPHDEPLKLVGKTEMTIYRVMGLGKREAWLAKQFTLAGTIDPKDFGPWEHSTARPFAVRFKLTFFLLWRIAFVFALLPLAWCLWRWLPRRGTKGFDVEVVGAARKAR